VGLVGFCVAAFIAYLGILVILEVAPPETGPDGQIQGGGDTWSPTSLWSQESPPPNYDLSNRDYSREYDKFKICLTNKCFPCSSPGSLECGTNASCVSKDKIYESRNSQISNCGGCGEEYTNFCQCNTEYWIDNTKTANSLTYQISPGSPICELWTTGPTADSNMGDAFCDTTKLNNYFSSHSDFFTATNIYLTSGAHVNLYQESVKLKPDTDIQLNKSALSTIDPNKNQANYSYYNQASFDENLGEILSLDCDRNGVDTMMENLSLIENNYYCKTGDIDKFVDINGSPPNMNLRISSPQYQDYVRDGRVSLDWGILYDSNGDIIQNEDEFKEKYRCINTNESFIRKSSSPPICGHSGEQVGIELPFECGNLCMNKELPGPDKLKDKLHGYTINDMESYNRLTFVDQFSDTDGREDTYSFRESSPDIISCDHTASPPFVNLTGDPISISCSYNSADNSIDYTMNGCKAITNCGEYKGYMGVTGTDGAPIEDNPQQPCNSLSDCEEQCQPHTNSCATADCPDPLYTPSPAAPTADLQDDPENRINFKCCEVKNYKYVYNKLNCDDNYEPTRDIMSSDRLDLEDTINNYITDNPTLSPAMNIESKLRKGGFFQYVFNEESKQIGLPLCMQTCNSVTTDSETICDPDQIFLKNKPVTDDLTDLGEKKNQCCINQEVINTYNSNYELATPLTTENLFKNHYLNYIQKIPNIYSYDGTNIKSSSPICSIDSSLDSTGNNIHRAIDSINTGYISRDRLNAVYGSSITKEEYLVNPIDLCFNSNNDLYPDSVLHSECENSYNPQDCNPDKCLWDNNSNICNSITQIGVDHGTFALDKYNINLNGDTLKPVFIFNQNMASPDIFGNYAKAKGTFTGNIQCNTTPSTITGCDVSYIKYHASPNQFYYSNRVRSGENKFDHCASPLQLHKDGSTNNDVESNNKLLLCGDNVENTRFTRASPLLKAGYRYCDNAGYTPINPPETNLCQAPELQFKYDCGQHQYCYWENSQCKQLSRATCKQISLIPGRINSYGGYSKFKGYDHAEKLQDYTNITTPDRTKSIFGDCIYNHDGGYFESQHYEIINLNNDTLSSPNITSIMNCNRPGGAEPVENSNDMHYMKFDITGIPDSDDLNDFKTNGVLYDPPDPSKRICKEGYTLQYENGIKTSLICSPCPNTIENSRENSKIKCGLYPNTQNIEEYLSGKAVGNYKTSIIGDNEGEKYACKNKYVYNEGAGTCEPVECIIPSGSPSLTKGIVKNIPISSEEIYGGETIVRQQHYNQQVDPNNLTHMTNPPNGDEKIAGYFFNDPFQFPNYNYYCSGNPDILTEKCYQKNIEPCINDCNFKDLKPANNPILDGDLCNNYIDITSYYTEQDECIQNNHFWINPGDYSPVKVGTIEDGICIDEVDFRQDTALRTLIDAGYEPGVNVQEESEIPKKFRDYINKNMLRINTLLDTEGFGTEGFGTEGLDVNCENSLKSYPTTAVDLYHKIQCFVSNKSENNTSNLVMDHFFLNVSGGGLFQKLDVVINGQSVYQELDKTTSEPLESTFLYLQKFNYNNDTVYAWIHSKISLSKIRSFNEGSLVDLATYTISLDGEIDRQNQMNDNSNFKFVKIPPEKQKIIQLFKIPPSTLQVIRLSSLNWKWLPLGGPPPPPPPQHPHSIPTALFFARD